jgi:hypothetical protein
MGNSLTDSLLSGLFKIIIILVIFSPLLLYKFFKNNKDRENGIDPFAVEKQERAKKDKKDHDKFFKGQGY